MDVRWKYIIRNRTGWAISNNRWTRKRANWRPRQELYRNEGRPVTRWFGGPMVSKMNAGSTRWKKMKLSKQGSELWWLQDDDGDDDCLIFGIILALFLLMIFRIWSVKDEWMKNSERRAITWRNLWRHGSFPAYLNRLRRSEEASCLNCEAKVDYARTYDIPMQNMEAREGSFEDADWVNH